MWIDPMAELKPYEFHREPDWLNANRRWLMQEYTTSPVEPISWHEWLRLLGEIFTALFMLMVKRETSQAPEVQGLTLRKILSYPLHHPSENGTPFSLN